MMVCVETVKVPGAFNCTFSVVKLAEENRPSLSILGLSYPILSTAVKRVREPIGKAPYVRTRCKLRAPVTAEIKAEYTARELLYPSDRRAEG
jgi:hypothetical protein